MELLTHNQTLDHSRAVWYKDAGTLKRLCHQTVKHLTDDPNAHIICSTEVNLNIQLCHYYSAGKHQFGFSHQNHQVIHLQRRAGQTCDPLYYDLFENTLKPIFELNNCLEVGIYKLHIWFSLKGLNNPSQAKYPYMIGIWPYHNILIMI